MRLNEDHYSASGTVEIYARAATRGLTLPEKLCIAQVLESARGSVLDIGVGAGRTVEPLSEMFRRYVGIDYSEPMVKAARRLFPASDIRVMDARALEFSEPFDCVFFSFNGIDCVDYDDRQQILRSVSKLLRAGGFFIYSTHNIRGPRVQHWIKSMWVKELFLPLRRPAMIPRRVRNRRRNFHRQHVRPADQVALVNDPADGFAAITAYVDPQRE